MKNVKTAIILAGGKSSRLGYDKINIPYKGMRLIDYQVKQLKENFQEIIVVSNKMTHYNDPLVKVVSDEYKDIGPLAGLHVGLKHATNPYAFVIACDMPFINNEFINIMDSIIEQNKVDILLSKLNGYIEPFNAIYHKDLSLKIEEIVQTSTKNRIKDLIFQTNFLIMDQEIVDSYPKEMFYNLNTPDDVKNYIENDVKNHGKKEN